MKPDEFKKKLDIYGGDLSRWPQDDIKPAYALIHADAEAATLFAAAERLDAQLRLHQPDARDLSALAARIAAAAHVTAQEKSLPLPAPDVLPVPLFARAGGLLMAAVIGFVVSVYPAIESEFSPADSPLYAQEQAINDGNADIYQL